jgi:hypothetical protein
VRQAPAVRRAARKLRLTIVDGYSRDVWQAEFRDAKTAFLEGRLPTVLRNLEIRAA